MLTPDARTTFIEALCPPEGFEVDLAIATTYSLDLTAMLLAPLSFARLAGFGTHSGATGVDSIDAFALLKSIRAFAEKTTVYCQSSRISVPRGYHRLHAYLESSVVQVTPKRGDGVFHPKMWAMRMRSEEGEIRYRLLCLSRNLTFDQSWDTALVVEGPLAQTRTRAIAVNHPLGDFFETLPTLAVGPIHQRCREAASIVSDELRRVDFEFPPDFELAAFEPIGMTEKLSVPFDVRCDKRLIVSPFVTDGALSALPGEGGVLVSRIDELDNLAPATLARFEKVYVLADAIEHVEGDSAPADESVGRPSEYSPAANGLHAKLFVMDDGWNSHVWTGSANATTAAFSGNIEFLVHMVGKKSKVGVDTFLPEEGGTLSMLNLLQPYVGGGREKGPLTDEQKLEAQLRHLRGQLSRISWEAHVEQREDLKFQVKLTSSATPALPSSATLSVRPITIRDNEQSVKFTAPGMMHATFDGQSFEALTSFFAFTLHATVGEASCTEDFVVQAALIGAPSNRLAHVLESMLSSPAAVLRFLRLLLASNGLDILEALSGEQDTSQEQGAARAPADPPLLESMLRALAREPGRLDALEEVIADLLKTENGAKRLPAGFLDAWTPIQQARGALKEKHS